VLNFKSWLITEIKAQTIASQDESPMNILLG